MKNLSEEQIQDVSFPDAPVEDFLVDQRKRLATFCSDAFVGTSPSGKWFDGSVVKISFADVSITEEESKEISNYHSDFALREICEFIFTEGALTIRGFSVGSGLWTEYKFFDPTIEISYGEDQPMGE